MVTRVSGSAGQTRVRAVQNSRVGLDVPQGVERHVWRENVAWREIVWRENLCGAGIPVSRVVLQGRAVSQSGLHAGHVSLLERARGTVLTLPFIARVPTWLLLETEGATGSGILQTGSGFPGTGSGVEVVLVNAARPSLDEAALAERLGAAAGTSGVGGHVVCHVVRTRDARSLVGAEEARLRAPYNKQIMMKTSGVCSGGVQRGRKLARRGKVGGGRF